MSKRQFTNPLLIQDGRATSLERLSFDERHFTEDHLQALLFEHPTLIPAGEIEPIFAQLIPVCRELPTAAGPLDLLYITSDGNLALVETKLWRNPQARRSVVAQLIDYAKELARWSYIELCDAVQKARGSTNSPSNDPLVGLLQDESEDFDEVEFHDRVSRNLRLGRFLLLIIGDGIREDVEHMAEFLQQTPQLGYTLGLIEIGLYRSEPRADGPLFVQPRIAARTREINRAVVEIRDRTSDGVEVSVATPMGTDDERAPTRSKITEEQFLEELAENSSPEVVEFARWVIERAEEHGLSIDWGSTGPSLKYIHEDTGHYFTLGQLRRQGVLDGLNWLARMCQILHLPDSIWANYLERVENLLPGSKRYDDPLSKRGLARPDVRMGPRRKKDRPPLELLAKNKEAWFDAIDDAIIRIREALDQRNV